MNIRDIRGMFSSRRAARLVDVAIAKNDVMHLAKYVTMPYGAKMTLACSGVDAKAFVVQCADVAELECLRCRDLAARLPK